MTTIQYTDANGTSYEEAQLGYKRTGFTRKRVGPRPVDKKRAERKAKADMKRV